MSVLCLIQCGYIELSFWSYKASPLLTLAITLTKLLSLSDIECAHEQIHCMRVVSKTNAVSVYRFFNDLLC